MKLAGVILLAAGAALASSAIAQNATPPRADWITATNQPCKIWNPMPQPNESVTWEGECKDGYASGEGVLRWTENGKPDEKASRARGRMLRHPRPDEGHCGGIICLPCHIADRGSSTFPLRQRGRCRTKTGGCDSSLTGRLRTGRIKVIALESKDHCR
jgi:hypothetical protein